MIPDLADKSIEIIKLNLTLLMWTEDNWELRLGGDVFLTDSTGRIEIDNTVETEELPPRLKALIGQKILDVTVSLEGDLSVVLERARIAVGAGYDYEAWQLSGPDGEKVVCMPGGELAIWGPRRD